MKKFLFFSVILKLAAFAWPSDVQSQKQYDVGYKVSESLTSALTISVTPANSITLYTLAADTSITINAVTTYGVVADLVYFRIKGNTRQRVISWGTNMDSANDTIATNKTWTFCFIYDGTAYKKVSANITD